MMSKRTRTISIWLMILAGLLATDATAAYAKAQNKPPGLTSERVQAQVVVELAGQSITPVAPLTVSITPKRELNSVLAHLDERETTLRLTIQVQMPKAGDLSGFQVFLNGKNKQGTAVQSSIRVGNVFFYNGAEDETTSFMLDMGAAFQQLKQTKQWHDGAPLNLSLVGIARGNTQKSDSPEIRVTRISITALLQQSSR